MSKLGMVGRKQEQLIESQEALDERLRQVCVYRRMCMRVGGFRYAEKPSKRVRMSMHRTAYDVTMPNVPAFNHTQCQVGDSVDDVKANTHSINFRVSMLDGKVCGAHV